MRCVNLAVRPLSVVAMEISYMGSPLNCELVSLARSPTNSRTKGLDS